MTRQSVIIEQHKRFSESKIWHAQRDYYDTQGIEAWAGDVPFYITSNSYIAGTYAALVLRFIQDWLKQHPAARKHPFYALELGTGSGQFSYYFLKHFSRLRDLLQLEDIKFCYVMSDFTQNNVDFWLTHPGLAEFVDKGLLDFAVFDVEHDSDIRLIKSDIHINANSLSNPLTVVANYLFDTVVSDVFNMQDNELHESLVSMHTSKKNSVNGHPVSWPEVKVSYTDKPVKGAYYDDEQINAVLKSYEDDLSNGSFFFPIGSLRVIRQLMALSNQQLLLLTSDKGNIELEEFEDSAHPELDFHGSFSVMVNYDAIARYFEFLGGDYYMQCSRDAIATAAFLLGATIHDCPEFQFALDQMISEFSPADYFNFYENIEANPKTYKLDALASALSLSRWDPGLYSEVSPQISALLEKGDGDNDSIEYLKRYLHRVADHYYHMPGSNDTLFEVASFFQEVDDYSTALVYYDLSRAYFPSTWELEFNCGYCEFSLEHYDKAVEYFEKALAHKPRCQETKGWLKDAKRKAKK